MELLGLPNETLQAIAEQMIIDQGLFRAQRLRLINKLFDSEIRRATIATKIIDSYDPTYLSTVPTLIGVQHLEMRTLTDCSGFNELTTTIQQTIDLLLATKGQQSEGQRREYIQSLCTATFTHMYEQRVFRELRVPWVANATTDQDVRHLFVAAVLVGNSSLLKRLLETGADINAPSQYFGRALTVAASQGHTNMVSLLIEHRANVGNSDHSYPTDYERLSMGIMDPSGLGAAAFAGHKHIVHLILDSEPHTSTSGHKYEAAVLQAARGGHTPLMLFMMTNGRIEEPTRLQELILLEACLYGREEIVRLMLDAGTNPNFTVYPNGNVLESAAYYGSHNIVKLLLEKGANPDGVVQHASWTPLHRAVIGRHAEMAQTLLDHGADINAGFYNSPLFVAALQGKLDMLRFLLERGAALGTEDKPSDFAVAGAAYRGYEPIVRTLVEHGASIGDMDGKDNRAMLNAMAAGHHHVVKTLIELGAKEIDPLKSKYAAEFASGKYPVRERYRGRLS